MSDHSTLPPLYVINLDRRPDRLQRVAEHVASFGLEFIRFAAVDALDDWHTPPGTLVSRPHYACWLSHAQVLSSISVQLAEYAVILEDDVELSEKIDWQLLLANLPQVMQDLDIHYLQLGHISEAHHRSLPFRLAGRVARGLGMAAARGRTSYASLGGLDIRIRHELSLSGAHAYVVSKTFASAVQYLNQPGWTSSDGFYERLASSWTDLERLRMATVLPSLVEQESRHGKAVRLDSDLE